MSKCIGTTACNLAYLFNSASKQCCEVWAFLFTFLHNIIASVPASVACLYGCINWSLLQLSLGLSQPSTSYEGCQGQAKGWV